MRLAVPCAMQINLHWLQRWAERAIGLKGLEAAPTAESAAMVRQGVLCLCLSIKLPGKLLYLRLSILINTGSSGQAPEHPRSKRSVQRSPWMISAGVK